METNYSQNGNVVATIAMIVLVLSKFGIETDAETVITIIAGFAGVVGLIHSYRTTHKLGQALGAYRAGSDSKSYRG